jgi:hypothetical protein
VRRGVAAGALVSIALVLGVGGRAGADERPPVRLELSTCLPLDAEAVRRAVYVELGTLAADEDASATAVSVDCTATGVLLSIQPAGSERRYRYALDWSTQATEARPRLLALAIAEAVDASRLELTALPAVESAAPAPATKAPSAAPAAPPAHPGPRYGFALEGGVRDFAADHGASLRGGGLALSTRRTPHLGAAADLLVEGGSTVTTSGVIEATTLSTSLRGTAEVSSGDWFGEVGAGARVGVVRLRGQTLTAGPIAAGATTRVWLGPAATVTFGVRLASSLRVALGAEVGFAALGATARDLGDPALSLSSTWTSLWLAASIDL